MSVAMPSGVVRDVMTTCPPWSITASSVWTSSCCATRLVASCVRSSRIKSDARRKRRRKAGVVSPSIASCSRRAKSAPVVKIIDAEFESVLRSRLAARPRARCDLPVPCGPTITSGLYRGSGSSKSAATATPINRFSGPARKSEPVASARLPFLVVDRGGVARPRRDSAADAAVSASGSPTGKFATSGIENTLSTTAAPSTTNEDLPDTAGRFERNQNYSRFRPNPRGARPDFSGYFERRKSLPQRKMWRAVFAPWRRSKMASAVGEITGFFRRESTARKDSRDGPTSPEASRRVRRTEFVDLCSDFV